MKIVRDTAKYQKLLLDKKTQSSPLLKRTDLDDGSRQVKCVNDSARDAAQKLGHGCIPTVRKFL